MNGAADVDFNALTNALTTILTAINQGNTQAAESITTITTTLGILEIVLFAGWIMYGGETLGTIVKKFLALQFWLWFIRGFQELAKIFMKSMVAGAFAAAGGAGNYQSLLDPSNIAGQGLNATMPLAEHVDSVSNFNPGVMILMGAVLIIVMGCFILMATNIAWAVIEFYIYLSLSALLVPFAIFGSTRFLADKAINAVIAGALKLAALAFVLALIKPILAGLELHPNAGAKLGLSWNEIFSIMMVTFFCLGLCFQAPRIAAGLIHASPTMSGTGAVMFVAGWAVSGSKSAARAGSQLLRGSSQSQQQNNSDPKNRSSMSAAASVSPMSSTHAGSSMNAQPMYANGAGASAGSPSSFQSTGTSESAPKTPGDTPDPAKEPT